MKSTQSIQSIQFIQFIQPIRSIAVFTHRVVLRPWALALWGAGVFSVAIASPSRITGVTVYPGSATIERVAHLVLGGRSITFSCLPASLDVASLQVQADASVRIGEFHILTQDRDISPACASPLEGQIRNIEDQIASIKAEAEALQLVNRYLNNVAGGASATDATPPRALPTSAAQIAATAEALRQSAQASQSRVHPLQRRQQALELALKPLLAEQSRVASQRAQVVSVTVNVASEREADVRLSYQVRGPSWQPTYRASLEAGKATVQLERLALVSQSSGEDWANVQLTLSTGQPGRATQGRLPRPWTLDIAPPPPKLVPAAPPPMAMAMAAPAPAPMARAAEAAPMPRFDMGVFDKGFATEFAVPQRITVPSSGQRVTLALGTHNATAQLVARAAPAEEEMAYLVANLAPPPGVWPAGPVGLYRDGAFVGTGRLDFSAPAGSSNNNAGAATTSLSFGRDELVRVRSLAPQDTTGSTGLTGSRTERRSRRSYSIDNRHTNTITLQVLHAVPVSRNEKIEIESHYQPAPTDTAWNAQSGTIAWQQPLAAGASATFSAEHTIRYAKDLELLEHPLERR